MCVCVCMHIRTVFLNNRTNIELTDGKTRPQVTHANMHYLLKVRIGNILYMLYTSHTFFQSVLCKGHSRIMPFSFRNGYAVEHSQVVVAWIGKKGKWASNDTLSFIYSIKLCVSLGINSSWFLMNFWELSTDNLWGKAIKPRQWEDCL